MIMNYHEMIAKGFTGEPYSMFFHVWPWIGLGALFYHVVLMAGIVGATKAGISEWAQGLIMVADAVCLFWFWWLVGKKSKQIA